MRMHLCFLLITVGFISSKHIDVHKIIKNTEKYFDSVFGDLEKEFAGFDAIKSFVKHHDSYPDHKWLPFSVLDKYPDNYKNHTSKVEDVDGMPVYTNETVYKKTGNHSSIGIYIKHVVTGNKTSTSAALKPLPSILKYKPNH